MTDNGSIWMYLLIGLMILMVVLLIVAIYATATSKGRRIKNPVKALAGSVPPKTAADYEYNSIGGVKRFILFAALYAIVAISKVLLDADRAETIAWLVGMGVFIVIAIVLLAQNKKRIIFSEEGLKVENCCTRLADGISGQSLSFRWDEVEQVDYTADNPVITLKSGDRYELVTKSFLYGPNRAVKGFNRVEIGIRAAYYAHLYGTLQTNDFEDTELLQGDVKKSFYHLETTVPLIIGGLILLLAIVTIVLSIVN